jgi:hypothetical protein
VRKRDLLSEEEEEQMQQQQQLSFHFRCFFFQNIYIKKKLLGFCTDKTSVSVPLCLAFYY